MGTKLGLLVGAAGALAIACGADSELASGAMRHAGDAMVDAGRAMLGADVDGSVDAQADASTPTLARRTLTSTCDQVRTYSVESGAGPMPRTQRFARFDADAEDVRSVWMCGDRSYTADACPAPGGCAGAVIGKPVCILGAPTWTDDAGAVWVSCGNAATVRLVVD